MLKEKYYEKRWYDGEQEFTCGKCDMKIYDYLFDDEDPSNWHTLAGIFFSKQQPPVCPQCNQYMSWTGYTGDTKGKETVAGSILSLINNQHYMSACIIFSSATEYQLNSLLWSALVDAGLDKENATQYADGKLSNGEIVRILRIILSRKLKTIVLPARNNIVHGREFGNDKAYFISKLHEMKTEVAKWVDSFQHNPAEINQPELNRWFLYMRHWLMWCDQHFPQI